MNSKDLSTVMRNLDVALSLFDSLQYMLEHNAGLKDLHSLSCLSGEGKRQLNEVVDILSDRL